MRNQILKKAKNEPIKVILFGDSGVGKTNIILRYIKDKFNKNSIIAIGTTFKIKELKRNNIIYNLNVWDTTEKEAYESISFSDKIIILVYNIDKKDSFKSLDYWLKQLRKYVEIILFFQQSEIKLIYLIKMIIIIKSRKKEAKNR